MSNVNVQLQDENGNNTFPYTYTNNVFDKNGNPINDRLLYGTREAITILPTVTTPASQNMITEQYDTTKTYPTYSKYCIYDNQLYKYSGASGTTTTGTFDNTKWTATNVIDSIDWNTLNNKPSNIAYAGPALATENVPAIDAYLHKSDVVDNFTDGGTDVPLSAECGKLLNSTLTGFTDVTTDFIVGTPSSNSAIYKNNKNVDGIMIITGVTIGVYNTLPASLMPKANRAVFNCYSFSTGALMTNLTCWILTDGTINFYGTAPGSTTQVAIPIKYLTV